MSTWEERMSQRARARVNDALAAQRKAYLGEEFLRYWPPDFDAAEGIRPEIIAARCLGIKYGDPGPRLPEGTCRECWGDRHVWLGNAWGVRHAGGTMSFCEHPCHEGEVWLAANSAAVSS